MSLTRVFRNGSDSFCIQFARIEKARVINYRLQSIIESLRSFREPIPIQWRARGSITNRKINYHQSLVKILFIVCHLFVAKPSYLISPSPSSLAFDDSGSVVGEQLTTCKPTSKSRPLH